MAEISAREFALLHAALTDGFKGVHERLDAINGRVRVTETAIAVLEDRAVQGKGRAATYGAGAGAVLVALAEAAKAFFK